MEKKLLKGILMLMLVVLGGTNVSAEEIKASNHNVSFAPASCEDDKEEISAKAIKEFRKMFSFASNEYWYKVSDGYIVKFVYEGIQYRAGYDAKGRWINTVKSYDATKLPADV